MPEDLFCHLFFVLGSFFPVEELLDVFDGEEIDALFDRLVEGLLVFELGVALCGGVDRFGVLFHDRF